MSSCQAACIVLESSVSAQVGSFVPCSQRNQETQLPIVQGCRHGWADSCCVGAGALIGHPVEGVRVALTDGAAHAVDSSELAFKLACQYAFRDAYSKASPTVLEPIMAVEVMLSPTSLLQVSSHLPACLGHNPAIGVRLASWQVRSCRCIRRVLG